MPKKVFALSVTVTEDFETGIIDVQGKSGGVLTTEGYTQLLDAVVDQMIKICVALAELSGDSVNKDLLDQLLAKTSPGQTKH